MPRAKRKRAIVESDSENEGSDPLTRRSSLRVNLSFTSNLSDSDHGSLKKTTAGSNEISEEQSEGIPRTVRKHNTKNTTFDNTATRASVANVTVINATDRKVCKSKPSKSSRHSILSMKEKEQQLDKSCMELKNAIISKTQVLSDTELTKKTSEALTGCSSHVRRMDDVNHGDRSPKVRINIGKNDQIIMTGCGEKPNPVQIDSMSKSIPLRTNNNDKASQNSDQDASDYSQSIASTPKKSNIETSVDKSTGKTSQQIINIPVARLFAEIDPNDSMSEINSLPSTENVRSSSSKEQNASYSSNIHRISNGLNNTISPILSQGTRKTRISRLSLRKKLTTDETGSSRVSTNTTIESFINRPPLTCSSFLERPEKNCNKSHLYQHTKTIILEENSGSSDNQNTINLEDNENNTNTINIDHSSTRSSMEITTISARTPITRKSFQQVIQQSFKFDTADIPGGNKTHPSYTSNQQSTNANESSIKKAHKLNSTNIENNKFYQDHCSNNTRRTGLNTSLDDVSLSERLIHKENKKSSNTKLLVDQTSKNNAAIESQTLTTMRSSLRVNTSLDSVRKSSDSTKTDSELEKKDKDKKSSKDSAELQPTSSNSNQDTKESTETRSHRPSNGTVRSSMQMNTSLDSVQKSPNIQEPLNYNKILSLVEEAPSSDNSEAVNLQCQSSDNDSEIENTPLLERIQSNSVSKKKLNDQDSSKKKRLEANKGKNKHDSKRQSNEPESPCSRTKKSKVADKNELERKKKTNEIENSNLQKSDLKNSFSDTSNIRSKSSRKSNTTSTRTSVTNENVSSTANESSVVEPTPFPASRSFLVKTMIRNEIARKLVDSSDDDENGGSNLTHSKKTNTSPNKPNSVHARNNTLSNHSSDTVILNTSDESSNESKKEKKKVVIDDSMNDTGNPNKSKINRSRKSKRQKESRNSDSSDEEETKKLANKRKLYPLRENSQISFSPAEITEVPRESAPKNVKKKKKRKMTQKKQENVVIASPESTEECDRAENDNSIPKLERKKKKPRKIKSKKIVVKKVTNMTLLNNMLENDKEPRVTKDRSSLREFDLRRARDDANKESKNHKIVIVVTGHEKDDKDLVKNVVKNLGSAILQANVTPRTTHVVSSGVRTINLLKGIIRGCWLLTLEWALKSLESEKWLDPLPYEMSHFAKAVQINRRDRHIFGKGYVPELFIACGPIYIENGTSPPASTLKDLVKTAGGRITEDPNTAKIVVGMEGLKENWIFDCITTGEVQPFDQYKRN